MMHAQYHPCCTAVPNRAVHIATAPLQQRQWLFLDEPLLWQVGGLQCTLWQHSQGFTHPTITTPGHLPRDYTKQRDAIRPCAIVEDAAAQ